MKIAPIFFLLYDENNLLKNIRDIMRSIDDKNTLLADILTLAKHKGATHADALLFEGISVSTATRWEKLEKLERSEDAKLGLRFFVNQKQALVSTTDFSMKSLNSLVQRASEMACFVPDDQYVGLTPTAEIVKNYPTLKIYDDSEPTEEELIEKAKKAEAAALSCKNITNTEGAEAGWQKNAITMASSNGFAGHYSRSSHSLSAIVVAGEGTAMERDYAYHVTSFENDLESPEKIGKEAAERTIKRLNPQKIRSIKAPVIYEPRLSNSFLSYLASAINGATIARGTSFLLNDLGKSIFPSHIQIIDDPHLDKGSRSKPFDGEGRENKRINIVESGILSSWILDNRSSQQLGLQSTGHAARSAGSPPSPSATNLYMESGQITVADMISSLKNGLLVTEVIGSGFNVVTGDYSQGASGFWIENGKIIYPVNEITIAGNIREMFMNLTPANDLDFRYGFNAPTICIENMTIAGK